MVNTPAGCTLRVIRLVPWALVIYIYKYHARPHAHCCPNEFPQLPSSPDLPHEGDGITVPAFERRRIVGSDRDQQRELRGDGPGVRQPGKGTVQDVEGSLLQRVDDGDRSAATRGCAVLHRPQQTDAHQHDVTSQSRSRAGRTGRRRLSLLAAAARHDGTAVRHLRPYDVARCMRKADRHFPLANNPSVIRGKCMFSE